MTDTSETASQIDAAAHRIAEVTRFSVAEVRVLLAAGDDEDRILALARTSLSVGLYRRLKDALEWRARSESERRHSSVCARGDGGD